MQFDIMNGILALLYVILLIAWIPLIIRYWITWKRLKQYFIPFYIVVFIILVIMFEYRAIALIQV
ncbi:MAG: hypothetical protein ACFFCO_11190, partial [Promethearchaeota archaeon]